MIVTQFLHSVVHINSNLGNTYLIIQTKQKGASQLMNIVLSEYVLFWLLKAILYINNLHYYQIHISNIGGITELSRPGFSKILDLV